MSHREDVLPFLRLRYASWPDLRLVRAGLAEGQSRPHCSLFNVSTPVCLMIPLRSGLRYMTSTGTGQTRWRAVGLGEAFTLFAGEWALRDLRRSYDQLKLALQHDAIELVRNRDGEKEYVRCPAPADPLWNPLLASLRQQRDDPIACHSGWGLLLGLSIRALTTQPRQRAHGATRFHLLCDHLREHLADELSREELAQLARCHRSHISRLFQQHAGCSYVHWLERERLRLACELLHHSDLPLAALAHRCGFSSANYFIRRFRAAHGMTPTHWRQRASTRSSHHVPGS